MTERQQYLRDNHLRHVEEVHDRIEAAGFRLVELAERGRGGQPETRYERADGAYILIFGHARMELYRGWCNKVDGCRISHYNPGTADRVLARAAV